MHSILALFDEMAALVGAAGVLLLSGLVLRNPRSPRWLRSEGAAMGASLGLVVLLMGAFGYAADGLFTAGLDHYVSAAVTAIVLIAAVYLIWTIFHVGERFKSADAGLSPFGLSKHARGTHAPTTSIGSIADA